MDAIVLMCCLSVIGSICNYNVKLKYVVVGQIVSSIEM